MDLAAFPAGIRYNTATAGGLSSGRSPICGPDMNCPSRHSFPTRSAFLAVWLICLLFPAFVQASPGNPREARSRRSRPRTDRNHPRRSGTGRRPAHAPERSGKAKVSKKKAVPVAAPGKAKKGGAPRKAAGSPRRPAVPPRVEAAQVRLAASTALVVEQGTGRILFAKNPEAVRSIASITKLLTAMVILDSRQPLEERLTISDVDVDNIRHSKSHLPVGTVLPRRDLLRLALMASENRAAEALARNYPGGYKSFLDAMNRKAAAIGMKASHFVDASGLHASNSASGYDLARMVEEAAHYPLIREFTTTDVFAAQIGRERPRPRQFVNTNRLVRGTSWDIGLSKTGYIQESGRCLVMQATFSGKPTVVVLLNAPGTLTFLDDAVRLRRYVESFVYYQEQWSGGKTTTGKKGQMVFPSGPRTAGVGSSGRTTAR